MNEKHSNDQKNQSRRMKIIIPLIVFLAACAIFLYVQMNDSSKGSKVEGVSDDVYEQLVQQYFFITVFMDMIIEGQDDGEKADWHWMEDHELYADAEKYVEEHDDILHPMEAFPNTLLIDFHSNPDDFTDTEQEYIEKMSKYMATFQRVSVEEHDKLKEELKEALHITDSDNPF